MKIGFSGYFLCHPHTGIGQYSLNLLREFATQRPDIQWKIPVPQPVDFPDWPLSLSIETLPEKKLPTASLRKWFWEQFQVPAYFKKQRVDLAHYPYPSNPRWGKFSYKTVVTVHDTIPWQRPEYRRHLRSRLYQDSALKALLKADQLIAVSQTTAAELQSLFFVSSLNSKIQAPSPSSQSFPLKASPSIIPEAAPPNFSAKIQPHKAARPYFLYVGGYDPRKNVKMLLEAYGQHIQAFHEVDLVLVGAQDLSRPRYAAFPETRALREALQSFAFSFSRLATLAPPTRPRKLGQLATKKSTSQRLVNDYTPPSHEPDDSHFSSGQSSKAKTDSFSSSLQAKSDQRKASLILTPDLPAATLAQYYRGALAFVSPSLAEGFNLPLLEAAACETPILASDIPIHHEVLGDNALFFDPHSVESLGKALEKVILDDTERERLKKGAMQLHQKYSWKKAARDTLEVYKNLL